MANALGLLTLAVSGASLAADRAGIERAACDAGHTLQSIVEITSVHRTPVTDVANALRSHDIDVVITPSVDHFWDARHAILARAALVVLEPRQYHRRGKLLHDKDTSKAGL